jgi:hypothetical protein
MTIGLASYWNSLVIKQTSPASKVVVITCTSEQYY